MYKSYITNHMQSKNTFSIIEITRELSLEMKIWLLGTKSQYGESAGKSL